MLWRAFNRSMAALTSAAVAVAVSQSAAAQNEPVESFYKGKTLRIVIGYAAGGGYDLYGRVFAEQFGKYLPGRPTIVPQNMPGAGSFVAAKFLYDVAPKDGTVFGSVSQTLPLDAMMTGRTDIDVTAMPYVGRLVDNTDIGLGFPGAPFATFEDARKQEIVVGATGGASPGFLVPAALLLHAGAKFKIVSGYGGSNDIMLAMERREVQLVASVGLPSVLLKHPDWITERKAPVLYQTALKRHKILSNVPTIGELGLNDEGTAVLRTIAASADIGRAIITTPGVPPERLAALRKAFQAMVNDPEFIELMSKRSLEIGAAPGSEIDGIVREVARTPKTVLDKVNEIVKSAK